MKRLHLIILIFILLLNIFSIQIVQLAYECNKEYITATYCVNKDKPKMHCNGQCHLKKVVSSAQDDQSEQEANPLPSISFSYFSVPFYFSCFNRTATEIDQTNQVAYKNLYTYRFEYAIFHPPLV